MMPFYNFLGVVIFFLISILNSLAANNIYVTDRMQVIIRVAPNQDAKVVTYISTGEIVSLLENTNDGWVKIITNDNKEGWALSRYFIEDPPAILRLKEIDPQNKKLLQKTEQMYKEIQEAKINLAQVETRAQQTEIAYQQLRNDSINVIRLRNSYQKLDQEYKYQQSQIEKLAIENKTLRLANNLKWFLAGGGIFLFGWLLGASYSYRKQRWLFRFK